MKYSSHLILHTDGSIGRYPIVELDNSGRIVKVTECGEALWEEAGVRFLGGVIIPYLTSTEEFKFDGREEFAEKVKERIDMSMEGHIMLVDGFDLNTFDSNGMQIRELK